MPGPRILVTRSPRQSSALADRLRDLGAEPVLIPTIEIVDPESFVLLDTALAQLSSFDWLLFTSANAVEALHARLTSLGLPLPAQNFVISTGSRPLPAVILTEAPLSTTVISAGARLSTTVISTGARSAERRDPCISRRKSRSDEPEQNASPRITAIGPATARALAQIGLTPDLLPPQAVAESFAAALLPHARRPDGQPARFLLVRAEEAREHLPETLRAAGAEVTVAPAYRTVIPAAFIPRMRDLFSSLDSASGADAPIAAVTFTSASTVRNLFTMLDAAGATLPTHVVRASIGPITSAALRDLGLAAHVQAEQATVDSLASGLVKYFQENTGR